MTLYSTGWGADAIELQRVMPSIAQPRVLLVEDDASNGEYAVQALSVLRCIVEWVPNGEWAVTRALQEEFDLILMDSRIPNLCGAEAIRKIRQAEGEDSRKATPIVMVTAGVMKNEITEYIQAGADDVLAKPYSLMSLARTVRQWTFNTQEVSR